MKFCLDRIENGIAVCLCENEGAASNYEFALSDVPALIGLADGTVFEATLCEDGALCDVCPLHHETASRRARNKQRLQGLFDRSKK